MAEAAALPAEPGPGVIVKEGWLQKRGEHIRNWRDRYFILFDNGDLVGFRTQPERNNYRDPLNKFTVKDCQIMEVDRPRPYTFTIRGLQWTSVIERNFSVDTERERWAFNYINTWKFDVIFTNSIGIYNVNNDVAKCNVQLAFDLYSGNR